MGIALAYEVFEEMKISEYILILGIMKMNTRIKILQLQDANLLN